MIQQKLSILLQHGVIEQAVYDGARSVLGNLLDQKIILEEEAGEVFVMHLAMAGARQGKSEVPVAKMDVALSLEISEDPLYREVVHLWKELALLMPISFHENELDYLYLHLLAILSAKKET